MEEKREWPRYKRGTFRLVHRALWFWFRKNSIKRNNLLVALVLESGPWGAYHWTGLFPVAIGTLASFTGLTVLEVRKTLENLESRGFLVYDGEIVFLRDMIRRQNSGFSSSENTITAIVNHVLDLPEESRAVQEFIGSMRNEPEIFDLLEGGLQGGLEGCLEGGPSRVGAPPLVG